MFAPPHFAAYIFFILFQHDDHFSVLQYFTIILLIRLKMLTPNLFDKALA